MLRREQDSRRVVKFNVVRKDVGEKRVGTEMQHPQA